MKCPETLEELEEWEKQIPLCPTALYKDCKARTDSGQARSEREAAGQIAKELDRPEEEEAIRQKIVREREKQETGTTVPNRRKRTPTEAQVELKTWKSVPKQINKLVDLIEVNCKFPPLTRISNDLMKQIKQEFRELEYLIKLLEEENDKGNK